MNLMAVSMKNSHLNLEKKNPKQRCIIFDFEHTHVPVPNFALTDIGAWFLAVAESVGPNSVRHF